MRFLSTDGQQPFPDSWKIAEQVVLNHWMRRGLIRINLRIV
jgi:hypothetical protein